MANGKKLLKDEVEKPSWIIQAEAFVDRKFKDAESIKDPQYGPGLKPFDHKIFIGIMDLQMNHVNDVLVEGFGKKVAEHYDPIMELLKKLEIQQGTIMSDFKTLKKDLTDLATLHMNDIQKVNERFEIDEEKIRIAFERLEKKKEDIAELKKEIAILQPESLIYISEEIREIRPSLEWFQRTFKWWKLALFVAGITALWFAIHFFFLV
jgi:hypothetical protein